MLKRMAVLVAVFGLAVWGSWSQVASVRAAGQGRTKCQFSANFEDPSLNRLFMKLDVADAIANFPTNETGTRNDDLAEYIITVTVGTTEFTQTFSGDGEVKLNTFRAKLTGNGKILQVDLRELDLPTLLGLNADDDGKDLSTGPVAVTVAVTLDSELPETVLYSGSQTFNYKQKAGQFAKGKNF